MFSLIVGSVREIRRIFITVVGFTICNINLIEYLLLGLKGRSLDQHADRGERFYGLRNALIMTLLSIEILSCNGHVTEKKEREF